ncbi:hypothetical protein [Anaerosporobacter sp.]
MDAQLKAIQEYLNQCIKDSTSKLINDEFVEDIFDSMGVKNRVWTV